MKLRCQCNDLSDHAVTSDTDDKYDFIVKCPLCRTVKLFDKEDVVKSMMYPEQKEVFERVLIELNKLQESGII